MMSWIKLNILIYACWWKMIAIRHRNGIYFFRLMIDEIKENIQFILNFLYKIWYLSYSDFILKASASF